MHCDKQRFNTLAWSKQSEELRAKRVINSETVWTMKLRQTVVFERTYNGVQKAIYIFCY